MAEGGEFLRWGRSGAPFLDTGRLPRSYPLPGTKNASYDLMNGQGNILIALW